MDGNPKQLIVERIKGVTNILVTVNRNPSVDQLAAALALTLMLNKMDKHATAVFSGALPPAISFLEPSKTFENSVTSLRDFIIALDKEKADRLRYKVEDDVVRIFITPYRTTITQNDLQFSEGDFNVELVVALGVERRDDLDAAIAAHGRILHDATVVTINATNQASDLGSIDWSDGGASSLCEMLMSLSEALQSGLLDQQIASALLTGIVAATDRFSNLHTTPKIMTMSAQLMAAGANQQLIAAKLEEGAAIQPPPPPRKEPLDGPQSLKEGNSTKLNAIPAPVSAEVPPQQRPDGEMHISHDQPAPQPAPDLLLPAPDVPGDNAPHVVLPPSPVTAPPPLQPLAPLSAPSLQGGTINDSASSYPPVIGKAKASNWQGPMAEPPRLGGTLSATASEAEEAKLREERSSRNHTILSHDAPAAGSQSVNESDAAGQDGLIDPFAAPFSYEETERADVAQKPKKVVYPVAAPESEISPSDSEGAVDQPPVEDAKKEAPAAETDVVPTIAELERQAHEKAAAAAYSTPIDDARAAVDAALQTAQTALPPTPPPVVESADQTSMFGVPAASIDSTAPLPPPPPLPDLSTLPPLPPLPTEPVAPPVDNQPPSFPQFPSEPTPSAPAPVTPSDPGQFRIPGQ